MLSVGAEPRTEETINNIQRVRMRVTDLIALNLADSEARKVEVAMRKAYSRGNDLSLSKPERANAFATAVTLDIRLVDWLVRQGGPFDLIYRKLDRAKALAPNNPTIKNLRDVAEVIDDLIQNPPSGSSPPSTAQIMMWEGMTVEVGSNIGNTLCYYVAAAAVNFISGRDFAPSSFHRPAHSNPRGVVEGKEKDNNVDNKIYNETTSDDKGGGMEGELVPLPRIVQNLPPVLKLSKYAHEAALLGFVAGGALSISPPTNMDWSHDRGILRAMQPVLSDVVATALQPLIDERPASKKLISNSDIVVHFRCSDVPFLKHPAYHLLTYAWWRQAMRIGIVELLHTHNYDASWLEPNSESLDSQSTLPKPQFSVEIISCPSWNVESVDNISARKTACGIYSTSLARFLETLPGVKTPVDVHCRSPDDDFEVMVRAPLLIGSGSSMSIIAAHAANWPRIAIVPDTTERILGDAFPSQSRLPLRRGLKILSSNSYRIPHSKIDNYEETEQVLKLQEHEDLFVDTDGEIIDELAVAASV